MATLHGRDARPRRRRMLGCQDMVLRALALAATCAALLIGAAPVPQAGAARLAATHLSLSPADLVAGSAAGVEVSPSGVRLTADPLTRDDPPYRLFGVAESTTVELPGPSQLSDVTVDAEAPAGAAVRAELRGRIDDRWTEWCGPSDSDQLDGATAIQARVTLLSDAEAASPHVTAIRGAVEPWSGVRAAQVTAAAASPTVTLMATHIGMVGRATANGHIITDHDHFVALPSKRALSSQGSNDYQVQISYHGKTVVAPVWDIGPWNTNDDYWNESRERFNDLPRWTSEAEAAFFGSYNGGRDSSGRTIILPNSIDIADGTFMDDLGMTANDWVDVTFLWVNASSPPRRPTPPVTPKTPGAPSTPSTPSTSSRAAGYTAPMPGSPVYLPLVTQDPNGWSTSWTIENPSGSSVSGSTDLYDMSGAHVGQAGFNLQPWGSDTFSVADALGAGVPFAGSAAIKASGPVGVVANDDHPTMDRMSYEAVAAGSAVVSAPLVLRDRDGWSTGIQVQNLGLTPTVARITYAAGSGPMLDDSAMIGPMASYTFFQPANPALPRGFVGSATIQSGNGQPLAAVVAATTSAGGAIAYAAMATGADTLSAPVLYRRYNGWDSSMQIQNLNPSPARATIVYQGSGPNAFNGSEPIVVPGGGSITISQATDPVLPDGFVGSARIVADPGSRLAGVVSEVQSGGGGAMSYVLGRSPSITISAPLVTKSSDGWSAGIQAQNPNPVPAGVVLTFYDESGSQVYSLQDAIEPGGSRTYYPPSIPDFPAPFRGSAIIQATTGAPLAVVVNETNR